MPPASTECCTIDDIIAEVAASRMVWSGSAMGASTRLITWLEFKNNLIYDGTNPASLANGQNPNYSALIARAVVVMPPEFPVAVQDAPGPVNGIVGASWSAPSSGVTPTSYSVQFTKNGSDYGAPISTGSLSTSKGLYTTGDVGAFRVKSVYNAASSSEVTSNDVTIT
jgi:hypothetical protein